MSVALDLDSLLAPSPVAPPARRPRLRVVPAAPLLGGRPDGDAADACTEPAPRALVAPQALARPGRPAPVSILHAPSAGTLAAPLRLTHRGIAVLAALTAAVGGLLIWVAVLSAPSASAGPAHTGPSTVTVQSGDTLWALAARVAPGRDPRAEVTHLRRLNHLADPTLMPGQVLRLR